MTLTHHHRSGDRKNILIKPAHRYYAPADQHGRGGHAPLPASRRARQPGAGMLFRANGPSAPATMAHSSTVSSERHRSTAASSSTRGEGSVGVTLYVSLGRARPRGSVGAVAGRGGAGGAGRSRA